MELHANIHEDSDGSYWAEVEELPGCFASGFSLDEVMESLTEAIQLVAPDVIPRRPSSRSSGRKGSPRTKSAKRSVKLERLTLKTS